MRRRGRSGQSLWGKQQPTKPNQPKPRSGKHRRCNHFTIAMGKGCDLGADQDQSPSAACPQSSRAATAAVSARRMRGPRGEGCTKVKARRRVCSSAGKLPRGRSGWRRGWVRSGRARRGFGQPGPRRTSRGGVWRPNWQGACRGRSDRPLREHRWPHIARRPQWHGLEGGPGGCVRNWCAGLNGEDAGSPQFHRLFDDEIGAGLFDRGKDQPQVWR